jgi:antitoxin component HigA of HigAB toxin-antitoxin module
MTIKPIHTNDDYEAALREISGYFDNEPIPNTPEGDCFEVMLTLIESYEAKHFTLKVPNPETHAAMIEADTIANRHKARFENCSKISKNSVK